MRWNVHQEVFNDRIIIESQSKHLEWSRIIWYKLQRTNTCNTIMISEWRRELNDSKIDTDKSTLFEYKGWVVFTHKEMGSYKIIIHLIRCKPNSRDVYIVWDFKVYCSDIALILFFRSDNNLNHSPGQRRTRRFHFLSSHLFPVSINERDFLIIHE